MVEAARKYERIVQVGTQNRSAPYNRAALEYVKSGKLGRIGLVKERDNVIGSVVRAKVVKNKVGPPFRKAEFDITFDKGISWEGTVLDMGVEHGIVQKAGSWFSWNNQRLGQGREQARNFLMENAEASSKIEAAVREKLGLRA